MASHVVVDWGDALPCAYYHGLTIIIKDDGSLFRLTKGSLLADARANHKFPACDMWNMAENRSSGCLPYTLRGFQSGSWYVRQGEPGPYLNRKTMGNLQPTSDYFLISNDSWRLLPDLHLDPADVADAAPIPARRPIYADYPSKCPSCSSPAYVGFSTIECLGPHCRHRQTKIPQTFVEPAHG